MRRTDSGWAGLREGGGGEEGKSLIHSEAKAEKECKTDEDEASVCETEKDGEKM